MYKSVMIPVEDRPRTNITRVARPPLVNLNTSLIAHARSVSGGGGGDKVKAHRAHVLETIPGDMTLDEIM